MSLSRCNHPFAIAEHPTMEPEVKRAILASWAPDAAAATGRPSLRRPDRRGPPVLFGDVMSALKSLD